MTEITLTGDSPYRTAVNARRGSRRIRRIAHVLAAKSGFAMYFAGILIEALGLGLFVAYGELVSSAATFVAGLVLGLIGERRWPVPPQAISLSTRVTAYLATRSHSTNGRRSRGGCGVAMGLPTAGPPS